MASTLPTDRSSASSIGRWLLNALLLALIVLGVAYLALRYYLWPRVDDWRPAIVERVSSLAGRPVRIGHIETGFEGLLPSVAVQDLSVIDDDGSPLLEVPRAVAVLSPRMLIAGEPRLSVLQLDAPRVRVERRAGGRVLRVAGLDIDLDTPLEEEWVELLLSQRRILVRDATVDWRDAERDARQTIGPIALSLGSVGRRHRASLDVGVAGDAWRGASLALDFHRAPLSRVADWRRWNGEIFVGVDALDWAAAARNLPELGALPVASARAGVRAWLQFDEGHVHDALLKLSAHDLGLGGRLAGIDFGRLELEAAVRRERAGYDVRVRRLELAEHGGFKLSAGAEQRLTLGEDGRLERAQLATGAFDLAPAIDLARRADLDPDAARLMQSLRASGRITALAASWQRSPQPAWEVDADFSGLSMRRSAPSDATLPWFANVDGEVRIGRDDGELRIRSRHATLAFPGIFAEPAIALDALDASARWRVERDGERAAVAVELPAVRFANADAAGTLSGSYRTGGKGAGIVDLNATLERGVAARAVRYLPLVIPVEVRDWIAGAVKSGRLSDARMRLRGDLEDFPFERPADGDFSVVARLDDARLEYGPGWPAIERLQGQLLFERNGMTISMRSGRVFDVALGPTQARLRDYNEALLRVEGAGEGPVRDMVRFVNESPVATRIDDFTRDMAGRGNSRLQLRLDLPLDDLDRARVAGSVQFLRDDLTLDRTIPPLSGVTGTLEFSEQGLVLRGIEGRFLGGPLRVDGETPDPGHFVIRANGTIDADGIRQVVDNPLTRRLSGSTAYRATIDVRRRASSLTLESDLQGLGSTLPSPFDKPAATPWPLRVRTSAVAPPRADARSPGDSIRIELRDDLRMLLERARDPATQKLRIRRAALGVRADPVLPERGFSARLDTDLVDVDQWTPLLSASDGSVARESLAGEFTDGFSLAPNAIDLVAARVRVGSKELHDVKVGASRERDQWRANIASREVTGLFSWRDPGPGQRMGTLQARFSRLEIPKSRSVEVESLLDTPPESLPALDVRADEFVLGERSLGQLTLRATNSGNGQTPVWTVDELKVENPAARLAARGRWDPHGRARGFGLDFGLELVDGGGLLGVYGMRDAMRGGVGTLSGELHWSGSPLAIDYPSLAGRLKIKVGKGRFLKSEPGIAKLIGVLSLQSLPRRLTLDFSDVFAEGFAFDRIEGDATIEHGVARTDNLAMEGVQAQVRISGSANIAEETQDLVAEVLPEFNAGLASIAYGAMANPAIGVGSFVAQMVLRKPFEQLFRYEFEIKGPWADPQVSEKRRIPFPPAQPSPSAPK